MSVSDITPRNMRGGKCMADVAGAFARAYEVGRAYDQWSCAKVQSRKQRGRIVTSRVVLRTTYLAGMK